MVTAESFLNGGSYKAVTKVNELNTMETSGTLGGGFGGVASGAHQTTSKPGLMQNSFATLTQTAQNGILPRTTSDLMMRTEGTAFTGKITDDAGSYFSNTGYKTSSKSSLTSDTVSTTIGNSWEINWVNGIQVDNSAYSNGFGITNVGAYSKTEMFVSAIAVDPRTIVVRERSLSLRRPK